MGEAPADTGGEISVVDRQAYMKIDAAAIGRLAAAVLVAERKTGAGELTVSFVDKDEMTRLNSTYRGKAEPTDVLSFALTEQAGDNDFVSPVAILGDIIICPEAAAANAAGQGHSAEQEVMEMVVHGLLHLLGYEHGTAAGEAAMFSRQEELAAELIEGMRRT